jgi:glycosyltransferase 2 family protein
MHASFSRSKIAIEASPTNARSRISLSLSDCAVVFTMVMGVVLIPISIGGWGLREAAVVSLLSAHGVAREQALLFSLFLGLVFVISYPEGCASYTQLPEKM